MSNDNAIEAAREAYARHGYMADAIEAAAPIIRAEVERKIVEWFRNMEMLSVADAIERGDHRKDKKE